MTFTYAYTYTNPSLASLGGGFYSFDVNFPSCSSGDQLAIWIPEPYQYTLPDDVSFSYGPGNVGMGALFFRFCDGSEVGSTSFTTQAFTSPVPDYGSFWPVAAQAIRVSYSGSNVWGLGAPNNPPTRYGVGGSPFPTAFLGWPDGDDFLYDAVAIEQFFFATWGIRATSGFPDYDGGATYSLDDATLIQEDATAQFTFGDKIYLHTILAHIDEIDTSLGSGLSPEDLGAAYNPLSTTLDWGELIYAGEYVGAPPCVLVGESWTVLDDPNGLYNNKFSAALNVSNITDFFELDAPDSGTTTINATKQASEPDHPYGDSDGQDPPFTDAGGHSVWFKWTPTTSYGDVGIEVDAYSTTAPPLLGVYTGSDIGSLTLVTALWDGWESDTFGGGLWYTLVEFAATAGETYYIAVDVQQGATPFEFDIYNF